MRDRLLVRHFLWRFLEHDLISPNADRHVVLSALGGALVTVSLFMAILIAVPYQFSPDMPPGMVSLNSLDDRFLFTSASMLVMALAAVAQWDALALDARDTAVLGVLPIPRAVIVRSKFIAVAVLAIGVAVGWNLAPALLRFVAVPSKLGVSFTGALTLTLAHAVTTFAAGAFGFLAVLGLREVTSAVLGQARFQRISAAVQAALVVPLATALLLLPGAFTGVARSWLAQGGLLARALPPLWFVGLNETLAGSVIDTLPRTRPSWFPPVLVGAERNATDLYRSLWPRYHELASIGIAALVIAGVVTTAACMWNSRRLPMPAVRRAPKYGVASGAGRWIAAHVVARTPLRQAGFFFTLQTLSRQVSHRVALAASVAVGLSLTVITARGRVLVATSDIASVPLALLAGQSLLLGCVLGGFRHAVRIPAELRASTTFSLAWAGNRPLYISGVKRAGWIALVLPLLGGLFVWHATVLGVRLAVLHLGVGLVVSALLMETLFVRYRLVPFASGYVPGGELRARGVACAALFLLVSFVLASIERFALTSPAGYLALVGILMGLSAGVTAFDCSSHRPAAELDLDDSPALPTQRLDLAG